MANPWEIITTDIETDALLETCTVTHCASAICMVTGEVAAFRPHEIQDYLNLLKESKVYINHNIIGFDLPALSKLYGFQWSVQQCFDTLVVSRCLFPDRPGGHSLESLGRSLGVLKGDFGKTADWSTFTEEMLTYNIQDSKVTKVLAERQLIQVGMTLDELIEIAENGERFMYG